MNIVKPKWNWSGKLEPFYSIKRSIDSIALHHMAHPTWNVYDIDRAHKDNGWIGIGYNWWIAFDGTIYEGRGFNKGAGVGGHNSHILSIGFQGDYERVNQEMPKAQYDSGVELIRWLRKQVPSIKTIDGHKHWNATACPGKYFPLKQMIEDGWKDESEEDIMLNDLIKKYGEDAVRKSFVKLIESVNDDGKESEWATDEFKEAKDMKITDGTNPEMFATRQEVAVMVKRAVKGK